LQPGLPLSFPSNQLAFFDILFPFVTFEYIPPDYTTEVVFEFDEDRAEEYND